MPIKVLLINTLYPPNITGGAERSVMFLAEALVNQDKNVVVATITPNKSYIDVDNNGIKTYYIKLANIYWPFRKEQANPFYRLIWHFFDTYNFAMASEIAKIIDQEKPDIVHTNNIAGFSVSIWQKANKRKIPIVHTLRDHYILCSRTTMFHKEKNCKTACLECKILSMPKIKATNLVHAVVGNSKYVLERHLSNGAFQKTAIKSVIYNAYKNKSRSLLNKKTQENKKIRFGYLGQLNYSKGIEKLLETFVNINENTAELHIAGSGNDQYVRHLKNNFLKENIIFLGFVNPDEFLDTIDILIVPSISNDVLPRVIFEAYAHKIPVVASNRGGIPEIVIHQKTGWIFDPENKMELLYLLQKIIKNFNPDEHELEIRNINTEFTIKKIGNEYSSLYEKVISNAALK